MPCAVALAGCGYLLPRAGDGAAGRPAGRETIGSTPSTQACRSSSTISVSRADRPLRPVRRDPRFRPALPEAARLAVLIEVASIDLDLPAFEEELRGPAGSMSAAFPRRASRAGGSRPRERAPAGSTGELTLHGVTRAGHPGRHLQRRRRQPSHRRLHARLRGAAAPCCARTFGLGAYAPGGGRRGACWRSTPSSSGPRRGM